MSKTSLIEKIVLTILAAPLAIPLLQAIAMIAGHAGVTWPWMITGSIFGRSLLFQGFVLCAVAAYAILALRDARYHPFLTRTHVWFVVLFAALVLTALTGHDTRLSFWSDAERAEGLVFLAHVGAYLFVLSWVIRDAERFRWFLRVAVGLALGTLTLLTIDALQQHRALLSADTWRYQATALLGNPNFFAQWVLLVLVGHSDVLLRRNRSAGFYTLPSGRAGIKPAPTSPLISINGRGDAESAKPPSPNLAPTRKKETIAWCIAAVLLAYLGLVASSTALGLAVILLAFVGWWTHRKVAYGVVLACLLIALALVDLRGPSLLQSHAQALSDSFAIRSQIWVSGITTALTHTPWLGYGWGNADLVWNDSARDVFSWYSPYNQSRYDRMHNLVLEFLIAGGVLALAVSTILWGRLCIRAYQHARRDPAAIHTVLAVTTILAYLLWNFDSLMGYVLTSVLLMGAILTLDEPRHVIRLPTTDYGLRTILGIGITMLTAVGLSILVIQPLRASASLMRAEHLLSITEAQRTDRYTSAIIAAHTVALRVRHPYDLHAKDILDSMMRLAALPILTDTQRDALYHALQRIAERLAILHPQSPHIAHRTAWIHARFGNAEGEIAALERTVALAPTSGPYRFQLALAYLRSKRDDDARTLVDAFLREGLFIESATFLRGLLDVRTGDLAGGRRTISRVITTYAPTTLEWQFLMDAQRTAGSTDSDILAWYSRIRGYAASPDSISAEIARLNNDGVR